VARSGALLLDFQPQRILIAINSYFDHALDMPGRLSLFPERLARTTVVPDLAARDGLTKRLFIHMPDHQDIARFCVGRDGSDQSVGTKFRREGKTFFDIGLFSSHGGKTIGAGTSRQYVKKSVDPETREVRGSSPRIGKVNYR